VHVPGDSGVPVLYMISTMITHQCLAMSILRMSSNVVPMSILPMAHSPGTMICLAMSALPMSISILPMSILPMSGCPTMSILAMSH
jgi:hypothetical protein